MSTIVPDLPTNMPASRIDLARGLSCEDIEETSRAMMSGAKLSRQGDPVRHVYVLRIHSGCRVASGESSGASARFCGVNKTFSETL